MIYNTYVQNWYTLIYKSGHLPWRRRSGLFSPATDFEEVVCDRCKAAKTECVWPPSESRQKTCGECHRNRKVCEVDEVRVTGAKKRRVSAGKSKKQSSVDTPTPKGKGKAKAKESLPLLALKGSASSSEEASDSELEFVVPTLMVPSTGLLAPRVGRAFIEGMQAIVDELEAQRKASEAHYKMVEGYMVLVGSALGVRMGRWDCAAERKSESGDEGEDEEEEGEDEEEEVPEGPENLESGADK
jgi:hypothetical protein